MAFCRWRYHQPDYQKAAEYFEQSIELAEAMVGFPLAEQMRLYKIYGQLLYQQNLFNDRSIANLEHSIQLYESDPDSPSMTKYRRDYLYAYLLLPELWLRLSRADKAKLSLNKLEQLIQADSSLWQSEFEAHRLRSLGDYYEAIQEWEQAMQAYGQSYALWEIVVKPDSPPFFFTDKETVKQRIGRLYLDLEEFKPGISNSLDYLRYLEQKEPNRLEGRTTTLLNLAHAYRELGQAQRSDSAVREAGLLLRTEEMQSVRVEGQYAHSVALNASQKRGKEAFCEANFQKALRDYQQVYGDKHKNLARVYRDYAAFAFAQKQWEKADSLLNLAKQSLQISQDKRLLIIAPDWMVRLYELEGEMWSKRFQRTQDPQALESAFAAYQSAIAQLNELNTRQIGEESLLRQRNFFNRIFQEGIRLGVMRYQLDPQEDKWNEVFAMTEQSKAFLLRKRIGAERQEYAFGLPDSLREREFDLQGEIVQVRAQLGEMDAASSDQNRQLASRMLVLRSRQKSHLDHLQSQYPDYYAMRYASTTIAPGVIQQRLLPEQRMVAYHLGKEQLQIFVLGTGQALLHSEPIDSLFHQRLNQLPQLMQVYVDDMQKSDSIMQDWMRYFYDKCIRPIGPSLQGASRLTIIPDGRLSTLPFAALVDREAEEDCPYLICEHALVLDYSATVHYRSAERQDAGAMSLLGFFPDFTQRGFITLPDFSESITPLVGGRYVKGFDATKEAFYDQSLAFGGILHFSTHGMMMADFAQSHLAMSDTNLYAHEIFNTPLQAAMAVLPVCDGGQGTIVPGEGVMSLARAFGYAGCPTLITSLWKSNARSTLGEIIPSFYAALRQYDKAEALRQAQLQYLQQAKSVDRYPVFWAGLVCIGDAEAIKLRPPFWKGMGLYLVLGFVVVALALLWRSRSRRSNSSRN
ncbi:MAG: CHAT domain-containing protein, partial [Bacteroidota bacterium]